MNQDVFESYPIPKAVAHMALPTVLSMLVTIFYNMADTFFVGQTGDPNQVAAVSIATPVFLMLMAVGNIFGIGGSSFVSRLLGQGNKEKVKHVSSFCFYGCIAAGLMMTAVLMIGMDGILSLIGCSTATEALTRSYLDYIAFGSVFVVIASAFGNVVRGEGAAKVGMVGMMIGTIVNIVLDPIMILWMNMGVAGAAIATVIGNAAATVFYIVYLTKGKTILSISPKHCQISDGILPGVVSIGMPASINNILMSTSNIILNNFLAAYGDHQVAAMGVAMKANMLVVLLQIGVGMGVQPLIGYCFGAGDTKRLRGIVKFGIICNVILGSVITILYLTFTRQVISVFIGNAVVIHYGVVMLRALMLSGPVIGIMFVLNFGFQAMGKAVPSLVLSLSRQGLVFLPVLVIANRLIGLNGIIFAQPVADLFSLTMAVVMFLVIFRNMKNKHEQYEHPEAFPKTGGKEDPEFAPKELRKAYLEEYSESIN